MYEFFFVLENLLGISYKQLSEVCAYTHFM